jgi:outer membrane protein TolC
VSTTARTLAAASLVLVTAVSAHAQEPSKEHVKALLAQVVGQGATTPTAPGAFTQLDSTGPKADLTIDDAVRRAMERNVTLASQRLTPKTFDYSLLAAWAAYRPTLTSSYSTNGSKTRTGQTFEGGDFINRDTQAWNAGFQQALKWGGGNVTANWTNSRLFSDANNVTLNPDYSTSLQAQYTQPLLRNFKIDNNRTTIKTTEIQQDQAEIDLRATAASTEAQTRNAYWELVYAVQAVEAAQRSLELASKLVQDNQARVEIGTMAPIDIVQAQAEQANRRQQLVNAQATLRNNELALKRLIVSGTDDDLWRATINPVDRPETPSVIEPVNLEAALANALQNRTDLLNTRKTIESSNVTIENLKSQIKPLLNMVTTYTLAGRGGTAFTYDRITLQPNSITPGGYGDALANIVGFDLPTWNLAFNFQYPIGTSAAQANLARQRLLLEQNNSTIKTTELQIATDVTGAALTIRNTLESVQAAATSRELSVKRLEAAQSKFEQGMATNYEVVQAQRDLVDARNSELRALLNYRKALVDFQRVQISPR